MKKISLVFIAAFFAVFMLSATISTATNTGDYKLIGSVPVAAKYVTTDFLKNAYVINQNNQVMKYDSTGTLISVYSENEYGTLTSIDATSPFNVLMIYGDFATIATVDMRLNTRRLYKLSNIGINNIAAACLAHDNYIWVYDTDDARLKKINDKYELMYQSFNLNKMLGAEIVPNYMVEKDGWLYVSVPKMGIMMFDIMGTYYTSVPNTDLGSNLMNSFQVINDQLVFFDQGFLNIYNVKSKQSQLLPIPNTLSTKDVRLEKGRLYVLNGNELQFYAQIK